MTRFVAVIAVATLFAVPVCALAQTPDKSQPAATADMRGPGTNTLHKTLYCVKNAESGACEDCWSDGKISSARGTCNLLKSSTNAPDVRKGACALPANQAFCGLKKK
jgi:hypothetical protein